MSMTDEEIKIAINEGERLINTILEESMTEYSEPHTLQVIDLLNKGVRFNNAEETAVVLGHLIKLNITLLKLLKLVTGNQ